MQPVCMALGMPLGLPVRRAWLLVWGGPPLPLPPPYAPMDEDMSSVVDDELSLEPITEEIQDCGEPDPSMHAFQGFDSP